MITTYEDTSDFSRRTMPLWKTYLMNTFGSRGVEILNITSKEDDPRYRREGWDWLLVFQGQYPSLKVEIKTRSLKGYNHVKYSKDNSIAIEIMGNIDKQKLGSSIYASNSDVYAYGFAINGELKLVRLMKTQKLAKWIKDNEKHLPKRESSTDYGCGRYNTLNVLVPLAKIDSNFLFDIDNPKAKLSIIEDDDI